MSLKSVNLNLLPVLRELLRLRSVSAAGRALGRSPSAISEGLAQLRATFGDPLLVRTQGRMALTPRALDLIDAVEALCIQLEAMYAASRSDPAASERLFTIAAHDFHVFTLGPALVALFRDVAPGFSLRFVDLGHELPDQLAAREVDFALMPDFHLGELASIRLRHVAIREDQTVVLMRAGHPLAAGDAVCRTQLMAYEHIAFHPNWEPVDYRKAIASLRRHLPIRARTAQITMLPFFIAGTDYIAMTPEGLAGRMAEPLGLVHRPLADPEPAVRSVLAWSPLLDADPAHRWFRERVVAWVAGGR